MRTKDKLKTFFISAATAILTSCSGGKAPQNQQTNADSNTVNKEIKAQPQKNSSDNHKTAEFYGNTDATQAADLAAKTKKLKDKLRQDSLDNAIQKNIDQVGIDIRYNKNDGMFSYSSEESSGLIDKEDMDFSKISESYLEMQKERFAEPTKYINQDVDICERIADSTSTLACYIPEANAIVVNHFVIENKAKAIKLMMEKTDCSIQDADSLVNMLCKELNSPEFVEGRVKHEESHRDDFAANYFMPNLAVERMAQIQFFSEIKATMREAGIALQKYHEDGDISHFAPVRRYVNNNVKELISKTDDKEAHKNIVGAAVFSSWLDRWNVKDSPYNGEVAGIVFSASSGSTFFYHENITETKEGYNEYKNRVDSMFADVGYLGNMQKIVDPDFKLNDEIKEYLTMTSSNVFNDITKNSDTNTEAYERLAELFTLVHDCDSDGTRTQKEQDLINKTIQTLTEKAQTKDTKVNSQQSMDKLMSEVVKSDMVNN